MHAVAERFRFTLGLGIGVLLLIWFTRLVAISAFPPFIDEMLHVHGSEQVYTESPLTNADLGRQFTIWWLAAFQPHRATDPIWLGRVITTLAVLPGVAALMGIGRQMAGTWGLLFAGLLYLFSPYHQFFARLALADPAAAAAVSLALYFAYRLSRRVALLDAALVGICLFLAFGAKVSALPFMGIPLAAAVSLWPTGRRWPQQARWLAVALVTAVGLSAAFVLALRLFKHDFLSNSLSYGLTQRGGQSLAEFFAFQRQIANAGDTFALIAGYLGTGAVALLAATLLLLIARRQFFLPLCFIGPLLVTWASPVQESRFLVLPVAILLLCGAVVMGRAASHYRPVAAVALAVVLLWGVGHWLPFARLMATDPAALPLPVRDFEQYVFSDASGFGFAAARDVLQVRQPVRVIGLLPNCQGFRYLALTAFPVECPPLNPSGESIASLMELLNNARQPGTYAVLDTVSFVPATAPGQQIAVFERPGGGPALTLYDLAP